MLKDGSGVITDRSEAIQFLQTAAQKGHLGAIKALRNFLRRRLLPFLSPFSLLLLLPYVSPPSLMIYAL